MADIADFAAAVFFDAELNQADLFVPERNFTFNTNDGGTLKAGRDTAVEILLAGDVYFAHNVQFRQEGNFYCNIQRLTIDRKWRCIVHFVCTGCFVFNTIYNLFPGFEFHQRGAVIFTKLAERGAHMTNHFCIVDVAGIEFACRTITEELFFCQQLLMHFKSRHKSDGVVGGLCSFAARNIPDFLFGILVIGTSIEISSHVMDTVLF
ncbi:hypothetical protein DSECCO2_615360 [anaerobic digester metagenome]